MAHGDLFIARTGYTGEDGCEIVLPNALAAVAFFHPDRRRRRAVRPGGARFAASRGGPEPVRPGHGHRDQAAGVQPGLDRGLRARRSQLHLAAERSKHRKRRASVEKALIGLVLGRGGIPRTGTRGTKPHGEGVVTSGGFGPTMGCPVAMARIPAGEFENVEVELRGRRLEARVVKPPFVRGGKIRV